MAGLVYQRVRPQATLAAPVCSMHLLLLLKTFSIRMGKWNTRTMWLMGRSKQVSQSMGLSSMGPRMVVRSVLDQGTRTRVLGAASGTKHHTCGLPPKPLSKFITLHFILPHHPVMLESLSTLIRHPMKRVYKSKHG
jgi:hypothetical protein